MAAHFQSAFVTSTGLFLPGAPVTNDHIDRFIAPLSRQSERIKRRILAENGIQQRHYAIDENGATLYSAAQLAAQAVRDCIAASEIRLDDLGALCSGSSGGDVGMPGFANMVQGELHAPPMHTS